MPDLDVTRKRSTRWHRGLPWVVGFAVAGALGGALAHSSTTAAQQVTVLVEPPIVRGRVPLDLQDYARSATAGLSSVLLYRRAGAGLSFGEFQQSVTVRSDGINLLVTGSHPDLARARQLSQNVALALIQDLRERFSRQIESARAMERAVLGELDAIEALDREARGQPGYPRDGDELRRGNRIAALNMLLDVRDRIGLSREPRQLGSVDVTSPPRRLVVFVLVGTLMGAIGGALLALALLRPDWFIGPGADARR